MDDDTECFECRTFPELPDEAVVALNEFLESFYNRFQSYYFAQLHRWYHEQHQPPHDHDQLPLPFEDPLF